MKGIIGDMQKINIPLNPDAKPVKQRPYWLKPRYKEKIKT